MKFMTSAFRYIIIAEMMKAMHWTETQRKESFRFSFIHWYFSTDLGVVLATPKLLLSLSINNLLLSQPSQAGGEQEEACPASLGMSAEESRRDRQWRAPGLPSVAAAHTELPFEFLGKYLDGHCPSFLITSWAGRCLEGSSQPSSLRFGATLVFAPVSRLWRKASSLMC